VIDVAIGAQRQAQFSHWRGSSRTTEMLTKLLAGGGLIAALAASTCCIIPLSLGALGVGGASLATLSTLAPYQAAFRVAGILMLGVAFWLLYCRPRGTVEGVACAVVPSQRLTKTALWIGAVTMGLVVTSGWWERFVV
jgi:mercuric ion transport protein